MADENTEIVTETVPVIDVVPTLPVGESTAEVSVGLATYASVNSFKAGKILDVDTVRKHVVVANADGSHEIIDAEQLFAYGNPNVGDYFVVSGSVEFYIGKVIFEALFLPTSAISLV